MYAVVAVGGKQYRVQPGDRVRVEKIAAGQGSQVKLDQVLLVGGGASTHIGAPTVEGAAVSATVVEHGKSAKVLVFKKNRRKNYRRKNGHRQLYTELVITGINAPGESAEAAVQAEPTPEKAEAKVEEAAAPAPAEEEVAEETEAPADDSADEADDADDDDADDADEADADDDDDEN